jgi:hypothetical protein
MITRSRKMLLVFEAMPRAQRRQFLLEPVHHLADRA